VQQQRQHHYSNTRVYAQGHLEQDEAAKLARLRFYCRALISAPECFWALCRCAPASSGTWFGQVNEDLQWLWKIAADDPYFENGFCDKEERKLKEMPNDFESTISKTIVERPGKWKALLRRIKSRVEENKKNKFEYAQWRKMTMVAPAEKTLQQEEGKQAAEVANGKIGCHKCEKREDSVPAFMLHLFHQAWHEVARQKESERNELRLLWGRSSHQKKATGALRHGPEVL
jgi:hypothetical protein